MHWQQQRRRWDQLAPYLVILVISCLIVLPQVIAHSTMLGSDSIFHYNRFYEAAKQLQNWNLSFFQSNYGFQQSGRVVNAVYGPLFAYINGALLGIVRTWYRYQILTSVVIYWIAGVGMYWLSRKMRVRRIVGMALTIIYMNIGWLPRWETAQNMNAWGAALSPYLCICAIRMIDDHQHPVNGWQLMAIMTIIIQIHMLSSVFFTLALVPFFIIGILQADDRRQMMKETFQAVLGTLMLTANVWGALLEVWLRNQIAKPAPFELMHNVLHWSWHYAFRDYLLVGVGLLLLAQLVYVLVHWQDSKTNTEVTIIGACFLLLSSSLFPWRLLEQWLPILQRDLQFPDRLTVIAYPLLLAGIACTSSQISQRQFSIWESRILLGSLMVVATWAQISNVVYIHQDSYYYHTSKVLIKQDGISKHSPYGQMIRTSVHTVYPGQLLELVEKRNPDYLPVTKQHLGPHYVRSYVYEREIIGHSNQFQHVVLSGGRLCLVWRSNRSGMIRLPLITYSESQLIVNGRLMRHYKKSSIGAPYVHQRQGHNRAILSFIQPTWVTILMIVSPCGIVICLLEAVCRWHARRKIRDKISAEK